MQNYQTHITEALVANYGSVSADNNPLHFSKQAAKQAGYPDKIAHGMLLMAIAVKGMSPMLEAGWMLASYRLTFAKPLFVNDHLTINYAILKQDNHMIVMKVTGTNQSGEQVLLGKIKLTKAVPL